LALVQEAMEELPVGVFVTGTDGHVLASNQRARRPFGDLTGDSLAEAALRRVVVAAQTTSPAVEILDLHGSPPRRLELSASQLRGGAVVAVVVDASERRRLDAVRRDFVANVNHELRTPVGALAILAEALEGEREPEVVDRLARRISAEAERARALIEELLEFSKVEADSAPHLGSVAVDDVIDAAVTRVWPLAGRREVTVANEASGSGLVVRADAAQLVAAVANLIENGVKYCDPGGVVIVNASTDLDAVCITVTDDGIGIPARDLERIFERFYRVDAARDRRTGGTGLGLAIVRHVATNHGGTIGVTSQEGVGSIFTLRLPIDQEPS
jgi:two-component system sensor histidine kinase SenX3